VVTQVSARTEFERQLISEVVDCVGGIVDRNGDSGVNSETLECFFKEMAHQEFVWVSIGR